MFKVKWRRSGVVFFFFVNFEHITHQFSFVFIVKIEQVNIS